MSLDITLPLQCSFDGPTFHIQPFLQLEILGGIIVVTDNKRHLLRFFVRSWIDSAFDTNQDLNDVKEKMDLLKFSQKQSIAAIEAEDIVPDR